MVICQMQVYKYNGPVNVMFQYTLDDLRERVQASENELIEGLKKLEALDMNGELKKYVHQKIPEFPISRCKR